MSARPRVFVLPRWRAVLGGVAVVCVSVWVAYLVEQVRGHGAWDEVAEMAEARGVPLELADLLPAALPEADNFAEVSAWVWRGEAAADWRLTGVMVGDSEPRAPGFGLWWRGESVPLDEWRSYLGARDLVAWIDARHATDMRALAAASARPGVRFSVNHARGVFQGMAFVPPLRDLTRLFALRAVARVERGDGAGALEDTIVALRLAGMVRDEPFLLTQLTANTQAQWTLQAVRAGLSVRLWNEAELARLDGELARLDLLANGMRALRGDLAFSTGFMRRLADDSEATVSEVTGGMHGPAFVHHVPSGWIYQNMAGTGRLYLEGIFPAYDERSGLVDLARLAEVDRQVTRLRPAPYTILTRMFMTPVYAAITNCAATQTQVNLARLACALEVHRLRAGVYPAELAEMPGGVLGLHDLVTGEPPRYCLDGENGFTLYTTGANRRDDGGVVVMTPFGDLDPFNGDWVWPSAAH